MNNKEKAIFKVKLELEIITLEQIQRWAIETLEKDASNDLALDLCFLSKPEEILSYFNKLPESHIYTYLTPNIVNDILKDYLSKNQETVRIQDNFFVFFHKLLDLSKSLEYEDLFDLLDYYDDQFYLASNKYYSLETIVIFKDLLNNLNKFLSTQNK